MSASSAMGWAGREVPSATAQAAHRRTWALRFPTARAILLSTLCLGPLAFGAVQPWAWSLSTLLALAALVAWGVASLKQYTFRVYWSPLSWLWALFLAFGFVQLLTDVTWARFETRNALILLAGDFVLFFVAGQLFASESADAYRTFGRVVALFALCLGLFSIFQFFTSHGFLYWSFRPPRSAVFGPYVNRNDYAGLMEMLVPITAAYGLTTRRGGSQRALYLFAVAVALASLLLTGSRGAMVALLSEAVIFILLALRLKSAIRWQDSAIAGTLVLVAGIVLALWLTPGYLSTRLESIGNFPLAPELTLGQRLVVTRDTLAIFRAHPLVGTGLGTFAVVFPRYQSFADNAIWEHAHDDYAEALSDTGLIGGLLLLAGMIVFLKKAFGRVTERLQSSAGWIQLACALGCCGLLVHSFVDFNLHIPANGAWFAVCLALATAPPLFRYRSTRVKDGAVEA